MRLSSLPQSRSLCKILTCLKDSAYQITLVPTCSRFGRMLEQLVNSLISSCPRAGSAVLPSAANWHLRSANAEMCIKHATRSSSEKSALCRDCGESSARIASERTTTAVVPPVSRWLGCYTLGSPEVLLQGSVSHHQATVVQQYIAHPCSQQYPTCPGASFALHGRRFEPPRRVQRIFYAAAEASNVRMLSEA